MWPATVLSVCGLVVLLGPGTASPQAISFGNRPRPTPAPTTPSGARGDACTSAENTPGVCDTISKCPALKVHLRNLDIEYLKRSICGQDADILLCCAGQSADQTGPPQTPFRIHTPFRSPSSCGVSSFSQSLIVGGDPVGKASDFPWMAALRYPKRTGYPVHKCAGTVINERWVLTAGHCIESNGPVSATVRDLILGSEIDDDFDLPPEDVEIEKIIKHPDYSRSFRTGLTNDIALIKLKKSLVFSELLRPLCLPKRKRTTLELEQVPGAFIAGWGLTAFAAAPSAHLLWGRVNVTDHTVCANNYANTGRSVTLDAERQLCANGNDLRQPGCDPAISSDNCRGGVDTCSGDSGGPLMEQRSVFNRVRWFTIGIVSFGAGCGNPDLPGIYTRVDAYLDWIGDTVANN